MNDNVERNFYLYNLKYNENSKLFPAFIAIENRGLFEDYITGDRLVFFDEHMPKYNPDYPEDKLIYTEISKTDKNTVANYLKLMLKNSSIIEKYKSEITKAKREYELSYYKELAIKKAELDNNRENDEIIESFEKFIRGNK